MEELEEIRVERNTREDVYCTPAINAHDVEKSSGTINWVQNRTQFHVQQWQLLQTIGDVKVLNKLARQLK